MSKNLVIAILIVPFLFLSLFTLYSEHPPYTTLYTNNVSGRHENTTGVWNTISENYDSAEYIFWLNAYAIGIKLVLYMNSMGNVNSDWVKIEVLGAYAKTYEGNVTVYENYIAGYTRTGYDGDGRNNVYGLHVMYYLLPNVTDIVAVIVKLYSYHGSPRLYTRISWVEPWNTTASYWMYEESEKSHGLRFGELRNLNGMGMEMKIAALSCGTRNMPCKTTSSVSYFYGRVFEAYSGGLVDIYVDVNYAGGFNIAPESFIGKGNYEAKLDVGVATRGEGFKYFHTIFRTVKYSEEQLPELITDEVAKGIVDIASDIVADYAVEFITSPAGRLFLRGLPYIGNIIEWTQMVLSLGYDEIVAHSNRVVFSRQIPEGMIYIWTNLFGYIKSASLEATIMNFCGEPPWQNFIDKVFGTRVWKLDSGGVYVGGILLDYYNVPQAISPLPQGDVIDAKSNITVEFDKPIDMSSLHPNENSIIVYMDGEQVPFYEYFRVDLSSDGKTLTMYPNYHLEYNKTYRILLTDKIRGVDGTRLVKSYEMWFKTRERRQQNPVVYYVIPIVSNLPNHLYYDGKIFKAKPISQAIVTDLGALNKHYVGEARFLTNDINIDYYSGGSGRLYLVNNSVLFIPLMASDWGMPPKRFKLIFEIEDVALLIDKNFARLAISWIKVGNSNIENSLRSLGIVEGAVLGLEPVPVVDYSIIAGGTQRIGEGILLNDNDPWLNGTKMSMYIVTSIDRDVSNLNTLLKEYKPLYNVYVGGGKYWASDIFVFMIVNATYMRAWRVVPLEYLSTATKEIHTYTTSYTTTAHKTDTSTTMESRIETLSRTLETEATELVGTELVIIVVILVPIAVTAGTIIFLARKYG